MGIAQADTEGSSMATSDVPRANYQADYDDCTPIHACASSAARTCAYATKAVAEETSIRLKIPE